MDNGWLEFWANVSVLQFIAWFLGIAAVLAFIVKTWPWLRRAVKTMDALAELPEFMDTTRSDIKDIHHELHHNNGTSVKDSQKRTEEAVERIELGVKGLYDRADAADAADLAMREEIERTRPPARKRATKPKDAQ